jgi:hypothetical protein
LYFPYSYSIEEASNIDAGMLFSLYQEKNKTKKNYRHAVEELSASGPSQLVAEEGKNSMAKQHGCATLEYHETSYLAVHKYQI